MACSCPSNLDMSAFGTQYWGAGCAGPFLGPTSQFVIIHFGIPCAGPGFFGDILW